MHIIIEHEGDGRSDPPKCRDFQVGNYPWLDRWGQGSTPFSHAENVDRVWTDKLDQLRVELSDGKSGLDAPAIPNATIIEASSDPDPDESADVVLEGATRTGTRRL